MNENLNHIRIRQGAALVVRSGNDCVIADHYAADGGQVGTLTTARGFGLQIAIDGMIAVGAPVTFLIGDPPQTFRCPEFIRASVIVGDDGIARVVRSDVQS
jgi:hypothetical protein